MLYCFSGTEPGVSDIGDVPLNPSLIDYFLFIVRGISTRSKNTQPTHKNITQPCEQLLIFCIQLSLMRAGKIYRNWGSNQKVGVGMPEYL